jgi:hypothetical protein
MTEKLLPAEETIDDRRPSLRQLEANRTPAPAVEAVAGARSRLLKELHKTRLTKNVSVDCDDLYILLYASPDVTGLYERLRAGARKLRTQKERGPAFPPLWGQDMIDANNATADTFDAAADILAALGATDTGAVA